jgi:hypothetical protein
MRLGSMAFDRCAIVAFGDSLRIPILAAPGTHLLRVAVSALIAAARAKATTERGRYARELGRRGGSLSAAGTDRA